VASGDDLVEWEEIASAFDGAALLVGNGLSISVAPAFAYGSLFDHAGLSTADRRLFAAFDKTTNFERVLNHLRSAIVAAKTLGVDAAPYEERRVAIQEALGHAVHDVHVAPGDVDHGRLHALGDCLRTHTEVFTTSYDMLVYWAMAKSGFERFCDYFFANDRFEFDPAARNLPGERTPVYFLHGALHLVYNRRGVTRKLTRRQATGILEQYGKPLKGMPRARPLLITEGSSQEKLLAIDRNAYLKFALQRLREASGPVVVFGHSLSEQDAHLIDALNVHPGRPVAVALRGPKRETRKERARIAAELETDDVSFFAAGSHPLAATGRSARPGPRRPRRPAASRARRAPG
jgi:hypothetical protein